MMRFKSSLLDFLGDDGDEAFIKRIQEKWSPERLEPLAEEDPSSMDTLGSLIDKLTTVNLKMWHNQEVLYAIRRMNTFEFQEKYAGDLDELHKTIKRCCDLNVQRAKLMDAIDKHISEIVSGKRNAEVFEQHKTY